MRRPGFIARQSGHPRGILGRLIGRIMARETAAVNGEAVSRLSPTDHDTILEVGFGHGRTIERMAAHAPEARVSGIDVSASMTRIAKRRNKQAIEDGRVDLRTGDVAELPFSSGQFNKVLSVHTIYFWPEPMRCLRELRRVMAKRGLLVLGHTRADTEHARSFPADVYTFYEDAEVATMLSDAGFDMGPVVEVGDASLVLAVAG